MCAAPARGGNERAVEKPAVIRLRVDLARFPRLPFLAQPTPIEPLDGRMRHRGGVLHDVRAGLYPAGSSVLFLMTGGTPGIFADKDTLAGRGA